MPLSKRWKSLDFFGSLENLHLPYHHHHKHDKSDKDKHKDGNHHHKHKHDKHDKHSSDDEQLLLEKDVVKRTHIRHSSDRLDKLLESTRQEEMAEEENVAWFRPRSGTMPKLSTLSTGTERRDESPDNSVVGLVQRCVIIQKDERGYGLTVSGDNPVYVASVKQDGAAAKAGVQKDDRIVKVNGTLVTNRNHIDVVKLIKSGSYVALTLMGRPNPSNPANQTPANNPNRNSSTPSNRDSARITAPQPVDPDKDRELWQQKIHMTQTMYETAKEDFEKLQRQYVRTPSERLHTQLLEKERTLKALDQQLRQLTGADEPSTPSYSQRFSDIPDSASENSWPPSQPGRGDSKHVKQTSMPVAFYRTGDAGAAPAEARTSSTSVTRSKSDAASRRNRAGQTQSTFYVGFPYPGSETGPEATSLPVSDPSSMSDSPHTSPSVSPTPDLQEPSTTRIAEYDQEMHTQREIITIDDEDVNSDDEQVVDTGPFSDIRLLEKRPAHMAVLLHYLISNSDPAALFFYIVSDAFKQSTGSTKDLRKWGYEIFSTFLANKAPLKVLVSDEAINHVSEVLATSASQNENTLRTMFERCRTSLGPELAEQLADFRQKRDLGLGNIFGVHELKENMDKTTEQNMIEKYLMPHLKACSPEEAEHGQQLSNRDLAVGWALATFFRQIGITKTSGSVLERVQSFVMKDKRPGIKFMKSSSKTKVVKGHQFNLQHFYVPTFCAMCDGLIWGVGYQGFLCTSCDMGVHKQCVEDIIEPCTKTKRGKRASAFIPVISQGRKPSNPDRQAGASPYSVTEALGQAMTGDSRSPPHTLSTDGYVTTQPLRKEDDSDFANALNLIAGLPTEHSVRSIVSRYQELASPTGPGPGDGDAAYSGDRKGSTDLSRSESLKGKGEVGSRPPRRAKSDVDKDDMFRAINQQSGSSSASSLSNRSVESPNASADNVNDALAAAQAQQDDSDLEVEELPPLKQVLGEDVLKKLKPKEKKRQEVINELFHTERAHLRNLKVLDYLFNRPMLAEKGVMCELSRALFPNIEEMISLHADMNKDMKERRQINPAVGDVGDILLKRFDGEPGDRFRKACAEYCRNQSFALEALKRHRRKDQRFAQYLTEAESNPLCRKLELKDHVPCQMQRLTKYPMLIENLLKYTQTQSEEYARLEKALERCKHILAYVNQAVRECENYHKLKDMQKRLDKRAIDTSNDANLMEIKNLDLTQHKLVFDGPLTWRLRSHRQIDLHVLLLEDILVLLQRTDDRLVLKCQSTNMQTIGQEYKYTHSPVLKLQNLLARNVATDKKAFFVINTSDTGPQIYELVAQTQDARKKWCKLINDKADEHKKAMSSQKDKSTPSPQPDEITMVRSRILRRSAEPSPPPVVEEAQAAAPASSVPEHEPSESIGSHATAEYQPELIHPDQVSVSGAVTAEATPVLSPLERLRRNDELIESALLEKEKIVASMLGMPLSEYHQASQRGHDVSSLEGEDYDEQSLVASCIQTNNRLIQLISTRTSSLAVEVEQQSASLSPDSGSGSSPSQLRQQQQLLAQGASGQSINVPIPMDQLRSMATEMNSILANLLNVMGTRGAERQSLRKELQAAQEQLEMLKAIQRQMSEQPPSTPQSRPQSMISVASSISETGEVTDSEHTEDDSSSVLNVAHAQELAQEEVVEEPIETVQQLETDVQPQVAIPASLPPNIEDDSDDGYEMIPENLPLPDDASVSSDTLTASTLTEQMSSMSLVREEEAVAVIDPAEDVNEASELITTDLDAGGEDGRTTPTPSPTGLAESGDFEEQSDKIENTGDAPDIPFSDPDKVNVEDKSDDLYQGDGSQADNNNGTSQDSDLTPPIEI